MIEKFIISPPFGNYITTNWSTSIAGTFTCNRRYGLVWQTMKTLRPIEGGWVNKIGFRNKGIKNVRFRDSRIYSIAGLAGDGDWLQLCQKIPEECTVEINVGCPNVGGYNVSSFALRIFTRKFQKLIIKIPPTKDGFLTICRAHSSGIRMVHLCNTIPVKNGGESGKRLKPLSLKMIEETKRLFPDMKVIGGGGIYTEQDLKDYQNAGADYFSLSTIWFTPWKVKKLLTFARLNNII